jgi:hypothetical protein
MSTKTQNKFRNSKKVIAEEKVNQLKFKRRHTKPSAVSLTLFKSRTMAVVSSNVPMSSIFNSFGIGLGSQYIEK